MLIHRAPIALAAFETSHINLKQLGGTAVSLWLMADSGTPRPTMNGYDATANLTYLLLPNVDCSHVAPLHFNINTPYDEFRIINGAAASTLVGMVHVHDTPLSHWGRCVILRSSGTLAAAGTTTIWTSASMGILKHYVLSFRGDKAFHVQVQHTTGAVAHYIDNVLKTTTATGAGLVSSALEVPQQMRVDLVNDDGALAMGWTAQIWGYLD